MIGRIGIFERLLQKMANHYRDSNEMVLVYMEDLENRMIEFWMIY